MKNVTVLFLISLSISQIAFVNAANKIGKRLDPQTTTFVGPDDSNDSTACKSLKSNSGKKYFIPNKTSKEYKSFLQHHPQDVVVSECLTYSWSSDPWGNCKGGKSSLKYTNWGSCVGGSASYSISDWGSCSVSCGGGKKTRSVECVQNADSGSKSRTVSCDFTGIWKKERTVKCVSKGNESGAIATVDDRLCDSSTKPLLSETCTPTTCDMSQAEILTQKCTPSSKACSGATPATENNCNTAACASYAWSVGTWGTCPGSTAMTCVGNNCGNGRWSCTKTANVCPTNASKKVLTGCTCVQKTRSVVCQKNSSTTVSDSFCSGNKPGNSQSCCTNSAQGCI